MGKVISKRALEDIRFRNDIADVIGSYFTLQKAGANFKALCPFHKEKTPSFHVNPQRQVFHCFGCGAGGDVFAFIRQFEGVDFTTAAKMLAQRANIQLELEEGEAGEAANKEALYRIHEGMAQFFRRCLLQMKSAEVARDYLGRRKLSAEVAEEFLIGYAPNRWDAALGWARKNGFSPEQMETAGLVVRSSRPEAKSSLYDRFRHRLMFPIRDEQGRVIGFSGRTLEAESEGAKYVNSPETPLFRKSRILYALDKARRPIVEAREAIICEGQIDVIRCHAAGFKTAVASQGTAFTEEHAHILRRYADSAVLVFDSDRAGQNAAIKTGGLFMSVGLAVRVATLAEGEDPDSFIRDRGAPAFQGVLDAAASVVTFQIAVLAGREDAASEVGSMRVARAVVQTVSQSPNAVQRAKLLQVAAERLGVPVAALEAELNHALKQSNRTARAPEVEGASDEPAPAAEPPREEVELCEHLAYVEQTPGLESLVRKYLPLDMLADVRCRAFATAALQAAQAKQDLQQVVSGLEDRGGELQKFAAQVLMAPMKIRGEDRSREDAVKDLILCIWRRRLKQERQRLARPAGDGEASQVQSRIRQITYDLKSLAKWTTGADIIEVEVSGANPSTA